MIAVFKLHYYNNIKNYFSLCIKKQARVAASVKGAQVQCVS